jgi:hypothetical protein
VRQTEGSARAEDSLHKGKVIWGAPNPIRARGAFWSEKPCSTSCRRYSGATSAGGVRGRLLRYRRPIDAVIDSLIAKARADPNFEDRTDVLILLQAR